MTPCLIIRGRSVPLEMLCPLTADHAYRGMVRSATENEFDRLRADAPFPIPGRPAPVDLESIRFTRSEVVFSNPGEFYFYSAIGAFKILILPEEQPCLRDIIQITSFVSKNIIHSMADTWLGIPGGSFAINDAERWAEKFFFSDQPLQLHCGEAVRFLAMCLQKLGVQVRRVWMYNMDKSSGHIVLEAVDHDSGKWIMLDPDFGVYVSRRGVPLSSAEIYEGLGDVGQMSVEDLGGKRWLKPEWNRGLAFIGLASWRPEHHSDSPAGDPNSYRTMLKLFLHGIEYHRFEFLGGWRILLSEAIP